MQHATDGLIFVQITYKSTSVGLFKNKTKTDINTVYCHPVQEDRLSSFFFFYTPTYVPPVPTEDVVSTSGLK